MTPSRPTKPHPPGAEARHGGTNADSPDKIARETLRRLALRKIPPTPDNYREMYFQIRGSADADAFPTRALKAIANGLPRTTPAETRNAQAFDAAIASGKWPELQRVITDLHTSRSDGGKAWGALIRDLSLQCERLHVELTQIGKREALGIAGLSESVGELLDDTRGVQESTLRARQELTELRKLTDKTTHEIARLHSELDVASRLIRHDPLTGALNRRGLDEALVREISRMTRQGGSLCIALIDIDNFKRFNDLYGHNTGDEALCHLTRTLSGALRPQDVVARYGGEEFIILLPDTSPKAANAILARLQRELSHRIFRAPDGERLSITFSAGITRILPGEQAEASIARADEAMYAAKRAGKNRVLVAV
ncbi:MAG: GGDEF domain-containing protein [Azoarcus sp.]|jgi:diguanylate cyclase (GGDEF)-like protein|nr:GGDEF domain-containing protein [Azoarcus sp.]